ncbi:MAG: SHOCT domain-containing protein [Mycobacterium sp.]
MMYWYDHDMTGWGYAGMVIGMILFWILLIVGIIALIRFSSGAFRTGTSPSLETAYSPEQILASRFARGEIDETEYHQRLDVLRRTAH